MRGRGIAVLLALVLVGVAGCEGPRGPAGKAGPKGDPGDPGMQGAPGEPGAMADVSAPDAGTAYGPSAWIACSGVEDLIGGGSDGLSPDGITETYLEYTITIFTNGDVSAQCVAGLGSAESAGTTHYYPGVTNGAGTGLCIASIDLPPTPAPPAVGHVGTWSFEMTQHAAVVTYHDDDAGHPFEGKAHTFVASECTILAADDAGAWSEVDFSKVFK